MAASKGGQFSLKEDHAIAAEVAAYANDVVVALSDVYGRTGDGAGGGGSEALCGAECDVLGASIAIVVCKVTAVATHVGNTVFNFATSVDGTNWSGTISAGVTDENQFTTVTVTGPNGAAGTCYKIALVDVRGVYKIKLCDIDNTAVAVAITANCTISKVI